MISTQDLNGFNMKTAISTLEGNDPGLKPLFDTYETPVLSIGENYFWSLCRSIIYQQLSGKAAKSIMDRFIGLYKNNEYPNPEEVLNTDVKVLRSTGLSGAKAGYIHNIARAFVDDVIINKDGCEILNDTTKELVVLD